MVEKMKNDFEEFCKKENEGHTEQESRGFMFLAGKKTLDKMFQKEPVDPNKELLYKHTQPEAKQRPRVSDLDKLITDLDKNERSDIAKESNNWIQRLYKWPWGNRK